MKLRPGLIISLLLGVTGELCAFSVSPPYQIITIKPGETSVGKVVITNTDKEVLHVIPTSKDWFVLEANQDFPAEKWLQIETKPFDLKQGEKNTVNFKVIAPKKAVGELVGMVSLIVDGQTQSPIQRRMSVAVYLAMEGTEKLKGKFVSLLVSQKNNRFQVGVELENKGNVHLRPRGLIQILDKKKNVVANIKISKGSPTYPGRKVVYRGNIPNFSLEPGPYVARIKLIDKDRQMEILNEERKFVWTKKGEVKLK